MYKLLLLSCMLASCLAGPHDVPSWIRDASRPPWRGGRGCADRRAGWEACAHVNSTVSLAPHPRVCRLFFYCSSIGIGIPLACRRCPAGLHFNPELLVCDWPNNVNCTAGPPPRPRPTLHPTDSTALPTDTTVIYSETPTPVAESTVAETSDQPKSMSTPPQY